MYNTLEIESKKRQRIRRWKSIESNDISPSSSSCRRYDHAKLFKSFLKASIASSVSIPPVEITSLGRVPASSIPAARCARRVYLPALSLSSSTFSLSLAETGSRFHEILPVMSVASITRHYPSISRFPSGGRLEKRTFRRSDTRNGSPFPLSSRLSFILRGYKCSFFLIRDY